MESEMPRKYYAPVHQSLIQPVMIAGVPRQFAFINWTTAMAISFGMHMPWIGLPLGLVLHIVVARITKNDVDWMTILMRYLRQPIRLET
ncbi:Type IV secretory pathway, VirB3-like protein [Poriferisphaera corsica]|uniref:Type IV secretory pathway, VirB3-like protein n=1 Tax=Poriferisphaera corsica TaxID=2528020 RepID=A0A517YSW9_9BACT|nr:VirB3 family type IV secretion system protein [Poriferisphaera corsica]QDU33252.1 Type IV secretory pathway, VirB3-like protein [Poriferisphaera corsica]